MRRLVGWMGVLWLLVGCTVPSLDELLQEKARECNSEHPCDEEYLCVQATCCNKSLATVGYRDEDRDGYAGPTAAPVIFCGSMPAGYASRVGDCNDSDANRGPGVSELCDGLDNDCDGQLDNGFDYYPDMDSDGAGDELANPVQVCPGATPPTGYINNADDCDDRDKHNLRGKTEVCDDRDNNCDARRDEGDICRGKGWKVVNDPALIGTRQWRTVGLGTNGRVWMAGDGGKLAVRFSVGQAFKSLDGSCGNVNWRAAWVSPTNNHVFLAGEGGELAAHNGNSCYSQVTTASGDDFQGIIGFSPMLYTVSIGGRLYVWSPGVSFEERYNLYPPNYFDIHGVASTQLLAVGGNEGNPSTPHISSYPGTGDASAVTTHTVSGVPISYNGSLRSVWMASSNLAYAVGDAGLVVKWDGATSWTRVNPPSDNPTAPFNSVVAPDPFTIYATDANPTGAIRRLSARGTWTTAYTSDRPLRDIALGSPGDIWAVGDDGRVVHFPE